MSKEKHDKELKKFVVASLRRASYRWYSRGEALKRARVERGVYKCESCGSTQKKRDTQLDHISPVVPVTGFDDWNGFVERMFCEPAGFAVLCQACHKQKTAVESELRKKHRRAKKSLDKDQ